MLTFHCDGIEYGKDPSNVIVKLPPDSLHRFPISISIHKRDFAQYWNGGWVKVRVPGYAFGFIKRVGREVIELFLFDEFTVKEHFDGRWQRIRFKTIP